ncbi:MAG: cupin domain-containing protein [Ilumatobacteraceae bacterium]
MTDPSAHAGQVHDGQVLVPCSPLDPTLQFFTQRLGFKVDAIFPADAPTVAVLSGHGLTLRLQPGHTGEAGALRLLCDDPIACGGGSTELLAPNGTRVELVDANPPLDIPALVPSLMVAHLAGDARWGTGRAGMQYRDIIPGRQGGRFIGSHIRIANDGPVPDYVHYHKVRFQMIYCHRGWARLVYEDQGDPFVLRAGDCVLQPPQIRHRVLESGDGLEVIELGCPAEHETLADRDTPLPTGRVQPDRDFHGQRFVRHIAADAEWVPWRFPGFVHRDTGIGHATEGLAACRVARPDGVSHTPVAVHDAEFVFGFVLEGAATLEADGVMYPLSSGDTFVVPAGMPHALRNCSPDLQLLDVTLPDDVPFDVV